MLASASRSRPTRSRQHSQRTTRRIPFSSTGIQPVSSQCAHVIRQPVPPRGPRGPLIEVTPELRRSPQLFLGARLDLTDSLARQVQAVPDLLQRVLLIVFEPEAQRHHLAFLAVEIRQRAR